MMKTIAAITFAATMAAAAAPPNTVEIADGVYMPIINLGTYAESHPAVGLKPWLEQGGIGIDTAWDYHDEGDIAKVLAEGSYNRSELFITTKIPAGFGNFTDCSTRPDIALNYVKDNLRQLQMDYVDLVLIHKTCFTAKANQALWNGLMQAKAMGLTRAIGVSNFNSHQIANLQGEKPAVNQCLMSVGKHDDKTISYCKENGIYYEAFFALKKCDMKSTTVLNIAKAHNATPAQVCLRWVLDSGCLLAAGTGDDPATVGTYTAQDLGILDFELTPAEVTVLSAL